MNKITFLIFSILITNAYADVPTLVKTTVIGSQVQFTTLLSVPLTKGYSVKIDYGKGLKAMKCNAVNCSLSYALTKSDFLTGILSYKIGVYLGNVLQGTTFNGNACIVLSPDNSISHCKISDNTQFTKISASGLELPDTANNWACTKDNKTGLVWAIKTADGGLHDNRKTYTWFNPNGLTNGYSTYKGTDTICYDVNDKYEKITGSEHICDWYKSESFQGDENNGQNTFTYTKDVNSSYSLCGLNNWRLPTKQELQSLVYCSDNEYKTLGIDEGGAICNNSVHYPTINLQFFPYSISIFWSSSSSADGGNGADLSNSAWGIDFFHGEIYRFRKNDSYSVMLVH